MRINNFSSNSFNGKLILPAREKNTIKKLELNPKDIVQIEASDSDNTFIRYNDHGNGLYGSIEPATIQLSGSEFLLAYNSAMLAPNETEIDLF